MALAGLLLPRIAAATEQTERLLSEEYLAYILPDHPRLFINESMLPAIRERAQGAARKDFIQLKEEVDALPLEAPLVYASGAPPTNPDGSLKLETKKEARQYFLYDGGTQASRAALLYLITGEDIYLQKAKNYLVLSTQVLRWSADNQVWMDLTGHVRINALAAYDWIYHELTPEEREAFMRPMLEYITNSQESGSFTFRRTIGNAEDGNYGESALRFFAGIAASYDGIDDAKAEQFLADGARLFVDMMNHRDKVSDGSGLLSTTTVGYSMGNYPYASFLFLQAWLAAFEEDVSPLWDQMVYFSEWFDYVTINQGEGERLLTFGLGDMGHQDNVMYTWPMYTHLAQVIHYYGAEYPEEAERAYRVMSSLPESEKQFNGRYPFVPFIVSGFSPQLVDAAGAEVVDEPGYFYNKSYGLLLMRSGKNAFDTYASFRFGSSEDTHQHYDELSFIIYKGGFLALDAGSRTEVDHHHAFAPQSVAHNTILIHQEGEPMPYFWRSWRDQPDGKTYPNHGGQDDKTRARAVAMVAEQDFIYAAGDATLSYAESKSDEVVRQFIYVMPDYFIIYDRVRSKLPDQKKEFLLHFVNEPEQVGANTYRAENGGELLLTTLLPENANIHLEGGPGREFWASGRNWPLDGGENWEDTYQLAGGWRLEISDSEMQAQSHFLNFIEVSDMAIDEPISPQSVRTATQDGLIFTDGWGAEWKILFNRDGEIGVSIQQTDSDGTVLYNEVL